MKNACIAFIALAVACTAQAQDAEAKIKIDTDRVIGEVDPHLFGNFTEHLGRCIYGGIFDEGNPLSDADGFRKDVMEATRNLGVSMLRWPGGNFVSGYNWTDGIGPRDKRPPMADDAWGALDSNRFGTDEFLKYCERVGAEPYMCINAGLGTIDQARHWVEYVNEPRDTYWARQRRANGHDKPYGVKFWGLGNEIDGPWQLGHKSAEDYATFALEAAKAMRRADDSIKLIASGSSNFRPGYDWIAWNRTVLDRLKDQIDYISLHTYIGNPENDFERFLAVSRDLDARIDIVEGQIKAAQNQMAAPHPIFIAFDEWNVWYRTLGNGEFEIGRKGLEEQYDFEDALAMGAFLNAFFRHAHIVKMANLAQLVNVIAPIFTNKTGLFLQTIYFPVQEYGKQRSNEAIDTLVKSPQYDPQGGPAVGYPTVGYLDVSTTFDAKNRSIYLNVLNRSKDRDIRTEVENVEGKVNRVADLWQMDYADFKATNTFGAEKIRPVTKAVQLAVTPKGFTYAFPSHSLSILKLKIQ